MVTECATVISELRTLAKEVWLEMRSGLGFISSGVVGDALRVPGI